MSIDPLTAPTTMTEPPLSDEQLDFHDSRAADLFRAFKSSGDRNTLEASIQHAENVLRYAPEDSGGHFRMTWRLGQYISERGNICDGVPVDLELSMRIYNAWMDEAADTNLDRPYVCSLMATALTNRFIYSSNREDLEMALQLAYKAIELLDHNHLAYKAIELSGLYHNYHLEASRAVHSQLRVCSESFEDPEYFDRLILASRHMLEESTKRNDPERWLYMDILGRWLSKRFEKTGNIVDLQETLQLFRSACKFTPIEAPDGHEVFTQCSSVLMKCHKAGLLPLPPLDESIEMLHTALDMCPAGSDDRVSILNALMDSHREAYERGRDVQSLHLAIEYGKQALAELSVDHPDRLAFHLDLATSLRSLFECSGQQFLLDEAIETYRTALVSPNLSSDMRAAVSCDLANALQDRYDLSGAAGDIEEAVTKARESISWTSAQDDARDIRLSRLSTSLYNLYNRFGRLEDLDEAIDCTREAEQCAWNRSGHGTDISNLSTMLSLRYERTHMDEDRSQSLMLARKAVEVTNKSERISYAGHTHNLAARMYEEYLRTSESEPDIGKLEEAISWARVALDCTPKTHTHRSYRAYGLGLALMTLAECSADVEKARARFDEAIESWKEASMPESASPMQSLKAARFAAIMLMGVGRWTEANELSTKTIALLLHVSPRSMVRQDMQFRLSGLSNISAFAAVASLNSGSGPEEALPLLEMGRGLIFGFFIGNRADVSNLSSISPDLSSQYEEIREQLTQMTINASNGEDVVFHRQELTKRLTSLEDQIRELPGMSRFQLPASGDELKELASQGPLVSFNVTKFRSDAFIVTSQDIVVVPLPALHEHDLQENVQKIIGKSRLTKCTLLERSTSNKNLAKILVWLWEVAVKPVMSHLGLTGPSGNTTRNLPRLWWITSGLMGLMPLHAAGSGWDESSENTASRCVSSYVHTMKALSYSRSRAKQQTCTVPDRILAVHTPKTNEEGWADLNTGTEMAAITDAASQAGLPCSILESPTVASVVDEMRSSAIVHFACHGDPSFEDPSQTALVLCGDSATPNGRLTVDQLFDETHQHAQLAYLSACCTAQQYDKYLIDEGIHLGSVFQLMGFPAVVATLWEADDIAAREVAGAFYRRLLGKGRLGEMEEGHVARCLHDAVAELRAQKFGRRKRMAEDILAWAPFVHIGI